MGRPFDLLRFMQLASINRRPLVDPKEVDTSYKGMNIRTQGHLVYEGSSQLMRRDRVDHANEVSLRTETYIQDSYVLRMQDLVNGLSIVNERPATSETDKPDPSLEEGLKWVNGKVYANNQNEITLYATRIGDVPTERKMRRKE